MDGQRFRVKDYLSLGVAVMLALLVWFVHNMSLSYSDLVQRKLLVACELGGFAPVCETPVDLAARCEMSGFDLYYAKRMASRRVLTVQVATEDMHHEGGESFYMTSSDLTKYFHAVFGDQAKLEYFMTDTLFFRFPRMNYRKVPVNPVCEFSFKGQYMAGGPIKVVPDSILVYGRQEQVAAIDKVNTAPIILRNLDSDVYGEIALEPVGQLRMSARKVGYSQSVVRFVERELLLPVRAVNVPSGVKVRVFPSTAALRMLVPFPMTASEDEIFVAVDYREFENSISGRCIGNVMGLPEDILGYDLDPQVFDCILQ